jgi:hypothetical protein
MASESPTATRAVRALRDRRGLRRESCRSQPTCANWIPPARPEHWRRLGELFESSLQSGASGPLLVYADDLERTAGVGGWETAALERYGELLRWLAECQPAVPVLLERWLACNPPREARLLDRGTFFEAGARGLMTEACLSPDYYRLLREGRCGLSRRGETTWRGAGRGEVWVWLGIAPVEGTSWSKPTRASVGHGLDVRLRAQVDHFHLLVGSGRTDDPRCQELLEAGRRVLHERADSPDSREAPAVPEVMRPTHAWPGRYRI